MFGSLLCCVFVLVCCLFSLEDGKFMPRCRIVSRAAQVRRATLESIGALLLQEATMMDHMEADAAIDGWSCWSRVIPIGKNPIGKYRLCKRSDLLPKPNV